MTGRASPAPIVMGLALRLRMDALHWAHPSRRCLARAANEASLGAGVRLLAVYSLGLGIPFVLAAVAIRPFLSFFQRFRRHLGLMEKIMGVLLVLTGIAFLNVVDWFTITTLGQWLIDTFPGLMKLEDWITPDDLQDELRRRAPRTWSAQIDLMAATVPQPIALTIAGSDSSGGAGIQADLKTFTALGVYGASVITALTAQNTHGVTAIHAIPGDMITAQLRAVATDLKINAVKTGMLGDRATVEVVIAGLREFRLAPLVVDPVMVATSGDVLLAPDAVSAVRRELIPLADLITPNLHEAAHLLDRPAACSMTEMEDQARRLLDLGAKAALVKGRTPGRRRGHRRARRRQRR